MLSKVPHSGGKTVGKFRHIAIQMASINENGDANQGHGGCSYTQEDPPEAGTDGAM
jgi:hypothetical protein